MAQKMTGALVFDERTDRYDIRFDLCLTTELCPVLPNFRKRKTLQSSKKDYNAL